MNVKVGFFVGKSAQYGPQKCRYILHLVTKMFGIKIVSNKDCINGHYSENKTDKKLTWTFQVI